MKTFNKAKTTSTATYYYNSKIDRFTSKTEGYGFVADVEIIVDAGLFAQDLDVIFAEVFAAI